MRITVKDESLVIIPETEEEDNYLRYTLHLDSAVKKVWMTTDQGEFLLKTPIAIQLGKREQANRGDLLDFMEGFPSETKGSLRDLGLMP